ncbi:hypothetical protein [Bacillus wiedmannii]|nr:hypothetical protein [Bacillus wiedmannii]
MSKFYDTIAFVLIAGSAVYATVNGHVFEGITLSGIAYVITQNTFSGGKQ